MSPQSEAMAAADFPTPYNQLLHALGLSEAVGTSSEAPAVYQTAEASVPQYNYMHLALGLDEFRASDLNITQHIGPVGKLDCRNFGTSAITCCWKSRKM